MQSDCISSIHQNQAVTPSGFIAKTLAFCIRPRCRVNRSVNRRVNRRVTRRMNRCVNRSVNHRMNRRVNRSVNRRVNLLKYLCFHQLWLGSRFGNNLPVSVYSSPLGVWLFLGKRERPIFSNHGVMSTLIHWLRPPLFLPWRFMAILAILSEGLADSPYRSFLPIEPSWSLHRRRYHTK